MSATNFNPRSREGSDNDTCFRVSIKFQFQSTLPRGERRCAICIKKNKRFISIHAPARGATMFSAPMISFLKISIHAPARGATDHARLAILIVYISIHAPARGATVIVVLFVYVCNISIHAPARGATLSFARLTPINSNFNPRSREGSDLFPINIVP